MNAGVILLMATLSCTDPALSFREFYGKYYFYAGSGWWAGMRGETNDAILRRESDAMADFVEYRVARMEKCRCPRNPHGNAGGGGIKK